MDDLEQRCLRAREADTAFDDITARIQQECQSCRLLLTTLVRCEQANAALEAEIDRLQLQAVELLRIGTLVDLFRSRPSVSDERQQRLRDICQAIFRARDDDQDRLFRVQSRRLAMLNQQLGSALRNLAHDLPDSTRRLLEYAEEFELIEAQLESASEDEEEEKNEITEAV